MGYFKTCPNCGAHLDPGENCDCSWDYYQGIGPEHGICVRKKDAFCYALERIANGTQEDKDEFEEWFYSGNWTKKRTRRQ